VDFWRLAALVVDQCAALKAQPAIGSWYAHLWAIRDIVSSNLKCNIHGLIQVWLWF
jgi:hypothetical protein